MHDEVKEIPASTPNFRTELADKLAELVPEAVADGKIDTKKLEELLNGDAGDTRERFGLFWPGKRRALRAAQEPTTATLVPDKDNSKDWETTQNVFVEGDNLEVLKILQKHYHGKIKMIYIDPPYNTGKDFVYPDNYQEGLKSYLEFTKQVDEGGKNLSTNSESEGRYHSNWLNMMYPRLKVARNLLADDGLIFISIDDVELDNLKKLANEVFGESNFVAAAPRKTGAGAAATRSQAALRKLNDYVLIYTRSSRAALKRKLVGQKEYPHEDEHGKFRLAQFQASGSDATRSARPNMWFPIYVTNDARLTSEQPTSYQKVILPKEVNEEEGRWLWSAEKFEQDKDQFIYLDGDTLWRKIYFDPDDDQNVYQVEKAWFEGFTNAAGTKDVEKLFGRKKIFDHPKPVALLKHLMGLHPDNAGIVLDFFAGSGSLAQAVMELNAQDGGSRRWINIQLPEPVPEGSAAERAGFETIADVARERIHLASKALEENRSGQLGLDNPIDLGFRSYRLFETNFAKWQLTSDVAEAELEQHLLSLRESADDQASQDALLTELLLKRGYSLTEQIAELDIAGLEIHGVQDTDGDYSLLAYLNEYQKPTLEQLRELVDAAEAQIIVLEDAFQGDDQLKTNLAQLCKAKGIELWTA